MNLSITWADFVKPRSKLLVTASSVVISCSSASHVIVKSQIIKLRRISSAPVIENPNIWTQVNYYGERIHILFKNDEFLLIWNEKAA